MAGCAICSRLSVRALLYEGRPLGRRLPGRIGLEIRTIVAAADRVLHKIEAIGYDVFHARPTLSGRDWPGIICARFECVFVTN